MVDSSTATEVPTPALDTGAPPKDSTPSVSSPKDATSPRRMPTMQSLVKRVSMVAAKRGSTSTVGDAALAEAQARLRRVEASLRASVEATEAAHGAWADVLVSQRDFAELFAAGYPEEDVVSAAATSAKDATAAAHKAFVSEGRAPPKLTSRLSHRLKMPAVPKMPTMPRMPSIPSVSVPNVPKVREMMAKLGKDTDTKDPKEPKEGDKEGEEQKEADVKEATDATEDAPEVKSDDDVKAETAAVTSATTSGDDEPSHAPGERSSRETPSHVAINTKVVEAYLAEIRSVLAACKATDALKADAEKAAAKADKRANKAKPPTSPVTPVSEDSGDAVKDGEATKAAAAAPAPAGDAKLTAALARSSEAATAHAESLTSSLSAARSLYAKRAPVFQAAFVAFWLAQRGLSNLVETSSGGARAYAEGLEEGMLALDLSSLGEGAAKSKPATSAKAEAPSAEEVVVVKKVVSEDKDASAAEEVAAKSVAPVTKADAPPAEATSAGDAAPAAEAEPKVEAEPTADVASSAVAREDDAAPEAEASLEAAQDPADVGATVPSPPADCTAEAAAASTATEGDTAQPAAAEPAEDSAVRAADAVVADAPAPEAVAPAPEADTVEEVAPVAVEEVAPAPVVPVAVAAVTTDSAFAGAPAGTSAADIADVPPLPAKVSSAGASTAES